MKLIRLLAVMLVVAAVFIAVFLILEQRHSLSSHDKLWTARESQPEPVATEAVVPGPPPNHELPAPPPDVPVDPNEGYGAPSRVPGLAISGHVVDEKKEPMPGAVVSVYSAESGQKQVESDKAGYFEVTGLGAGKYRVAAQKEHFNDSVQEDIAAGTGRLVLSIEPLSAVKGRVLWGDTGRPIERFRAVYLGTVPPEQRYWDEIARDERTKWQLFGDAEGRFRIDDVRSREPFAVGAHAEGYQPAFVSVAAVEPGATVEGVEIKLLPEATIEGQVLSPGKAPVGAAAVHLGAKTEKMKPVAQSDEDGRFRITGLGTEPVTLTAVHTDYLPGSADVSPLRGKTVNVDIVLGQGGTVEGTVLKGTKPLAGLKVAVSRLLPPRVRKEAETDSAGQYSIAGIPPGEVEAIVKAEAGPGAGSIRMQRRAIVEAEGVTTIDFRLPATLGTIVGTVTAGGAPAASAQVKVTVVSGNGDAILSADAQEDGSYEIRNVPPGDAWIEATATTEKDVEFRKTRELTVAEGEHISQSFDFDSELGIHGKILNLRPGDTCEVVALRGNVTVDVTDPAGFLELENLTAGRVTADEGGTYSLEGLEAGAYTVAAIAFPAEEEGSYQGTQDVRVVTRAVSLQSDMIEADLSLK